MVERIDDYILNDSDKNLINEYQKGWQDNKGNRGIQDSYHRLAEEVRRKNGYSGGTDGIEFIPVDTFKKIPVPEIQDYNSPWQDDISHYLEAMKKGANYDSPYSTQIHNLIESLDEGKEYVPKYQAYIDRGLQDMLNYHQYDYNPDNDPAYQRFLENVKGSAEEAYQDNLASFADLTGGYVSSWAEESANQAREAMNEMASEAVEKFDDLAYSKHVFETGDMFKRLGVATNLENQSIDQFRASQSNKLNLLHAIMKQDEIKYNRVRDKINDDKDMGRFILQLDENSFNKWKFVVEQGYKKFEAEAREYREELNWKKEELQKALEQTELIGYVSNEASFVLGVPTGTPSKMARQRAWAMEDFMAKADKMLEVDLKKAEFRYQKDVELEGIKHSYDMQRISLQEDIQDRKQSISDAIKSMSVASSGGSSGGGMSDEDLKAGMAKVTKKDKTTAKKKIEELDAYFRGASKRNGKRFTELSQDEKVNAYQNVLNDISKDVQAGAYGKNGVFVGTTIKSYLEKMPGVKNMTSKAYTSPLEEAHVNESLYRMLDPKRSAADTLKKLQTKQSSLDYYLNGLGATRYKDMKEAEANFNTYYEAGLSDFELEGDQKPKYTDYRNAEKPKKKTEAEVNKTFKDLEKFRDRQFKERAKERRKTIFSTYGGFNR